MAIQLIKYFTIFHTYGHKVNKIYFQIFLIQIKIQQMIINISPEVYHKKARTQLEDIKLNLKLLNKILIDLNSFQSQIQNTQYSISYDKCEKIKTEIRDKMKTMGLNLNEMIAIVDFKLSLLSQQLVKLAKNSENSLANNRDKLSINEEQYKTQINKLQQKIFQLQKNQNEYVKEISHLKEKNAKLREEFSNLSFDTNQRIKQLSEKLHNNTSPNLTIRRLPSGNPQTSYLEEDERKKNNNFVKIKGANQPSNDPSNIYQSPLKGKNNQNMLDSFTSQSSEYDIKGLNFETPAAEQNSFNLKFGCFPGKETSQKTKTGSTSEDKKTKWEQKSDRNRRFEFLLSNLTEHNKQTQQKKNIYNQSRVITNYQLKGLPREQYRPSNGGTDEFRSVFDQNAIKKYQI